MREESLRELGFKSYGEYLGSKLWAKIRRRRFGHKDGRRCSFCPERAEELHHNDYGLAVMSGKNHKALMPVCSGCHCRGSKSSEGWILKPNKATQKMRLLGTKRARTVPSSKARAKDRSRASAPYASQVMRACRSFESRFGTELCAFCDRAEEVHGKQRRSGRVSPEEKQRRKDRKRARQAASLAKRRAKRRVRGQGWPRRTEKKDSLKKRLDAAWKDFKNQEKAVK